MKATTLAATVVGLAISLAAPAQAGGGAPPGGGDGAGTNPDVDFSWQLQQHGIYGPRDYNAWLGKIVCERLAWGTDPDARSSVKFIVPNLPRGSTQAQGWEFLGIAINTYCPDKRGVYEQAANQ